MILHTILQMPSYRPDTPNLLNLNNLIKNLDIISKQYHTVCISNIVYMHSDDLIHVESNTRRRQKHKNCINLERKLFDKL